VPLASARSEGGVTDELERYVAGVLRLSRVVADRSWGHGDACVLEVRDVDGRTWFAKQHHTTSKYQRETGAYRKWVPALGVNAPTMLACDDELRTLVMSAVPGESAKLTGLERQPNIQRRAGQLLRRFHEADPPIPWEDFAAVKMNEFDKWTARAEGLLDARELDFARSQIRGLAEFRTPMRVPCHRDYTARNWLVADGRVHIIDFDLASLEMWVNDLARLYFGVWRRRPHLEEAFLEGYGRPIDDEDREVLHRCGALAAVSTVAWAHEHGDYSFEQAARQNLRRLMTGTE
jgi:tRNA A-37 threonylcarbamoyl transferase component Bud32